MEDKITEETPVQTVTTGLDNISDLQTERKKVGEQVEKKIAIISDFKKTQVDIWDVLISENPNSTTIPQWENTKKEREAMLDQLKAELETLQQLLTDIDARIAALQK